MLVEMCVTPEALVEFLEAQPNGRWRAPILNRIFWLSVWCWDTNEPQFAKREEIQAKLKSATNAQLVAEMVGARLKHAQLPPLPADAKVMEDAGEVDLWFTQRILDAPTSLACEGHEGVRRALAPFLRHSSSLVVRDPYILRHNTQPRTLSALLDLCVQHQVPLLEIRTSVFGKGDLPRRPRALERQVGIADHAERAVRDACNALDETTILSVKLEIAVQLSSAQHTRLATFADESSFAKRVVMIEPGLRALCDDYDEQATVVWYRADHNREGLSRLESRWDNVGSSLLTLSARCRRNRVTFSAKLKGKVEETEEDIASGESVWVSGMKNLLRIGDPNRKIET